MTTTLARLRPSARRLFLWEVTAREARGGDGLSAFSSSGTWTAVVLSSVTVAVPLAFSGCATGWSVTISSPELEPSAGFDEVSPESSGAIGSCGEGAAAELLEVRGDLRFCAGQGSKEGRTSGSASSG
jgi:hypothetical protein